MSTSVARNNYLSIDGEVNDTTTNATHIFEDENFWESDSSSDSEGLFFFTLAISVKT